MSKPHNPYFRELSEIKQAFASALTPENCIVLGRQLQRDCLHGSSRDKAWSRLFTLLDILGLKSVSPDLVKADEVKVYRTNPPSIVERAMRGERMVPAGSKSSPRPQPQNQPKTVFSELNQTASTNQPALKGEKSA